ncbi:MAG TPA: hypothetical protein PKY87_10210, partial [Terricaulis sp.]|nr:hypothetical protein [Terricaulis sp.]
IESEGGEWEIIQARDCVLVAPGEYEISNLLRGRLGSRHAMAAPHPAGARVVVLDQRLARFEMRSHEWGEPLAVLALWDDYLSRFAAGRLAPEARWNRAVLLVRLGRT